MLLRWQAMHKCDIDIRLDLYYNIVLGGGPSMALGFKDRYVASLHASLQRS